MPAGTRQEGQDEDTAVRLQPDTAGVPAEVRKQVYDAYLAFGEKVRQELGRDLDLLESEHFLIWTDRPRSERPCTPNSTRCIKNCTTRLDWPASATRSTAS